MELKDKLKSRLKEIEVLTEELNKLLEELTDEPEEKKDKIELLDEYMKSLDERLFVKRCLDNDIVLRFLEEDGDVWNLGYIEVQTGKLNKVNKGSAPRNLFNELMKYSYAFKGKYDELFKEDDNAETI